MARPTDDEIRAMAEQAIRDEGEPRCLFVYAALRLAGLAYADPATRDEYVARLYLQYIFPERGDGTYDCTDAQLKQAYAMAAAQSSCGITTEAIWRYAGVDDPRLYEFYADRVAKGGVNYAVALEKAIAEKAGCWVSALPWVEGTPLPDIGDASIIGNSSDTANFSRGGGFGGEHEFTTVAVADGLWHSVDGGQPGIAIRSRALLEVWTGQNDQGQRTGELWAGALDKDGNCATDATGRPLTGRRYIGYTSAAGLPLDGTGPGCGEGAEAGAGGSALGSIAKGVGLGALALGGAWGIKRALEALRRRGGLASLRR